MSNTVDLSRLRDRYLCCIAAHRGESSFEDHALSVEGAGWLVDYVTGHRPKAVLELGSGFSTLVLGEALSRLGEIRFLSADHSQKWMDDVKAVGTALAADEHEPVSFKEPKWWTLDGLRQAPRQLQLEGAFDLVLVDHGPTMEVRIDDLPWIASLLRSSGIMAFDDCRNTSRFERMVRRALGRIGWSLERAPGSGNGDKWIGVARRRLG